MSLGNLVLALQLWLSQFLDEWLQLLGVGQLRKRLTHPHFG